MNNDPPMERRAIIATRLALGQTVTAGALAAEFDISPDAIRRDLRELAAEGLCRRVYGGALPISPASTPMIVRVADASERKTALAAAALPLIQPSEFLFLDNGSTNLALAALLPGGLTVATNSVAIAAVLAARADIRLHLIGGRVDPAIGGCVDAEAVLAVQRLNIDRCFLGACSAASGEGMSAFDVADAAFKRTLLGASHDVAIMLTTDKLGTRAPYRVAPLGAIDALVVEYDAADQTDYSPIAALGIAIITAKQPALADETRRPLRRMRHE